MKLQQSSKLGHQQIFSDQHVPHVESSDIQQQMTSEAQVKEDVKQLYANFASVIMNVKVRLAVLVENEPSKLTQIAQYIEEHYQLSHLAEVKDVNELFDSISSHYCFLSCNLVKGVVEEFLSGDEVHSELTQYLKELDTFKMSTQLRYIKTAIKEVLLQNQEVTETCTVSIKLNEIWECTTLKKFENFFCLIFGKNFNYLNQLCTELGKECVCVSFVTPLSKLEFLIDKVLPQKEFIQRVGIIEMSINNDVIISPNETTITNVEQCFLEFAETGNQFGISTLLELGVDVNHKSSEGRTALMIASYAGHQQCVQMLTSANVNVDIQDNKGYTALMLATECNSIDIVSHLLSVNASVNLQTQDDDTALTIACRNCQADIVKLLLDYKADPLVANYKALFVSTVTEQHNDILVQLLKCLPSESDLNEVLSVACLNGQPQIIATLLQHIDTSITSEQIQITISCAKGDYSTVEKYINHSNVDVNYPFLPLLIIASSCGHISIVDMLLKQQANASIGTQSGLTSLMAASKNEHHHVFEMLQKYSSVDEINKLCFSAFNSAHYSEAIRLLPLVSEPKSIHTNVCDTNIPSTKGYIKYFDPKASIGLFHLAAWNGWLDIMKTLIDRYGLDPEMGDCNIHILHIAILNEHIDAVKYLISECGCDPMCKDNDGWTCLHYTGKCGSLDIMKYLITECQCDPMITNKYGSTCLHIAVVNKHIDVVKYLISECSCDPMCKDNNGCTYLHYAGHCGSLDIMKYLITECKCDPMITNNDGSTCLHIAVGNKHIDVVKYLISECSCDPMCKDNNGWTYLHYAGHCGSLDIMKYLITECKCDPMITNKYGSTHLHIAVLSKHIDVVKYLISECGCDPTCKNNNGWTCLHGAGECGSLDIMKYLITECKCDPMITNNDGSTCLHIAVLNKHIDVVKYLISECGCDPMCKDDDGWTCLHYAGQCGSLDIMKYLITECKCDPMITNNDGSTCLHIAVLSKHIDVVKYLISECGCDPMCKDNNGWTCLHYAGQCGSLDIMKYLITECKCDPMITNNDGSTCLHIAVLNKHIDVVKYLISECGCDPMCKDDDGWTCLHYAGQCGSLDIMKYLITECKCDPMITNNDGSTCLHIAVLSKHIDVVKYLISECGCDPMCKDNNGWTCLHYAGQCGSLDILNYLITECKCDPMITNNDGSTCLHIAVVNKHIDVVKYLISECGCDPMCKDDDGWTCLHYAGQCGSLDIMKYLITECKCDPMITNNDGSTCLHIAVGNKHIDVVKYLISECGCDPMCKDDDGWTCLHYAGQCGSLDITKYLITECKCDPMITDEYCSTCLHIAVKNKHLPLTEYLLLTGKVNPFVKNNFFKSAVDLCQLDKAQLNIFVKLDKIKLSYPVDSFVNVLLLGNSGAGKSTLAKVITERAISTAWFGQFRNVEGVEPYTAGIIPTKLTHHELGNIILYDFAGHPEYYTSHTAVIENLLQGSAAIFVIVVNIMEEATKHLQQWLTTVKNEVPKALNQCHIIVAVSHVDEMIDRVTRERKQSELQQIIKERCDASVSIEYLDCRRRGGSSVNSWLSKLGGSSFFSKLFSACQSISNTSGRNLSLYCHMMYGLLKGSKQNIFSLSDIISVADTSNKYFIPKNEKEILETLSSLHSTGLIALLKSSDDLNKVWVVVNKQILLAEVNGILFAPKSFKQYCDIASNTGIITVSALTQLFPDYDPDMLISFLKNMALCQEVDPQLFVVTNLSSPEYDDKERFLFFPTLLDVDRPDNIDQEVFQFGWCLQCTEHYHFFSSHFLHRLLLNLSFKYTLPEHASPNKLNCNCTFWKNGIHWFNGNGVGTLVELVDESQCVLVLMSCKEGYKRNMISLQKKVITEVLTLQKESCPSLKLSDFIVDPQDLTYPIDKPTQRTVYNVQNIIYCIINEKEFVINSKLHSSTSNQRELSELLQLTDIHHLSTLKGQELDKVQYKCITVLFN